MNDDQRAEHLAQLTMTARGSVKQANDPPAVNTNMVPGKTTAQYGGIGAAAGGLAFGGLDYALNRDKKKALRSGILGGVLGGVAGSATGLLKDQSPDHTVVGGIDNTLKLMTGDPTGQVNGNTVGDMQLPGNRFFTDKRIGLGAIGAGIVGPMGWDKLKGRITTHGKDLRHRINDARSNLKMIRQDPDKALADLIESHNRNLKSLDWHYRDNPNAKAREAARLQAEFDVRHAALKQQSDFVKGQRGIVDGTKDLQRQGRGGKWFRRLAIGLGGLQAGRDIAENNIPGYPDWARMNPKSEPADAYKP